MSHPFYSFVGGDSGSWDALSTQSVRGYPIEDVPCLEILNLNLGQLPSGASWLRHCRDLGEPFDFLT